MFAEAVKIAGLLKRLAVKVILLLPASFWSLVKMLRLIVFF